jgi:hypothetical protein
MSGLRELLGYDLSKVVGKVEVSIRYSPVIKVS